MRKTLPVVFCFLTFLVLRLWFLFTFPPFTDESFFSRWGLLMIHLPQYRWASLSYVGRQPLAMWLFGLGGLIAHHPLFGARLMVLAVNIPVFFFVWSVAQKFFSRTAAVLSVFILAVTPLFIFTQATALMDGLLFSINAAILWLITHRWNGPVPWQTLIIGILIGIGLWIKTPALLLAVSATIALVWKWKTAHISFPQIITSLVSWCVIPLIMLIPLFVRPEVQYVRQEPGSFVFSVQELLGFPVVPWIYNMVLSAVSLFLYCNPLSAVCTVILLPRLISRRIVLLALWFLIPFCITVIIGKHLLVRYFVLAASPLPILFAAGATALYEKIKKKWIAWALACAFTGYGIFFAVQPVSFFRLFPVNSGERSYAIGWPSGYGIFELTRWIDAHITEDSVILLAVADSPGNPSDFLLSYYYFSPHVKTVFATLSNEKEFRKLKPLARKFPLHLATRTTLLLPFMTRYITPVVEFSKPDSGEKVGLYKISFP